MTLTKTFLPEPVGAYLEASDLRIGCVQHVDEVDTLLVAVMQAPPEPGNTVDFMICTLLRDWQSVHEVIEALTETATQAWGLEGEPAPIRHVLRTPSEHEAALQEVEALMESDPARGSPQGDRLELLAMLVEDYERQHSTLDEGEESSATSAED
jgi:hypothetical protein